MIEQINLLRNFGQFDNVSPPLSTTLSPFSLIYAENGRGKTTVSSIFRSLAADDPTIILERHRLGSVNPVKIVLTQNGQNIVFENSAWNNSIPELAIFDDFFVAENICSGVELQSSHKQNLHQLIIGSEGVELNKRLKSHIAKIEQHNLDLRALGEVLSNEVRGPYTVNQFCSLEEDPEIDEKLANAQRRLAAAESADEIQNKDEFESISLPRFDENALSELLKKELSDINAVAVESVSQHISQLGHSGENWISTGMEMIPKISSDEENELCPFCVQKLNASEIVDKYKAYFSEAYKDLKSTVKSAYSDIKGKHDGDIPAAFERDIRKAIEKQDFWKKFVDLPEIDIDTAAILRDWKAALNFVLSQLSAKQTSPIELIEISQDTLQAIAKYHLRVDEITSLSEKILKVNEEITLVKERVDADDVQSLKSDLEKLRAHKNRFDPAVVQHCREYEDEKTNKEETERLRNETRQALEGYRARIFPEYEQSINDYLGRFNASFRLGRVESVNNRAGSSANYCIVINQEEVQINADSGPSFRNTLSAGDRNALALAFFFASLERDQNLEDKIIVIDDPMTSLDEHRTSTTVREVICLGARAKQVIILSHSKPFLCKLWADGDQNSRVAIRLNRSSVGSEIDSWDVSKDSVTEHDKRYGLVTNYLVASNPDEERNVAQALRPMMESFLRVAYPSHFPPGTLLGPFINNCTQKFGQSDEMLSEADATELKALVDYANKYHHDTNAAWETEAINDTELLGFAQRTLNFISK